MGKNYEPYYNNFGNNLTKAMRELLCDVGNVANPQNAWQYDFSQTIDQAIEAAGIQDVLTKKARDLTHPEHDDIQEKFAPMYEDISNGSMDRTIDSMLTTLEEQGLHFIKERARLVEEIKDQFLHYLIETEKYPAPKTTKGITIPGTTPSTEKRQTLKGWTLFCASLQAGRASMHGDFDAFDAVSQGDQGYTVLDDCIAVAGTITGICTEGAIGLYKTGQEAISYCRGK